MSATVRVRDVISGDVHVLPDSTRTVDVPYGFDDETGAGVTLMDNGDEVRVGYTAIAGGFDAGATLAIAALSSREPGSEFLAESTDRDDDGRAQWWLSEVVT